MDASALTRAIGERDASTPALVEGRALTKG
jgi:hypothetical protein